MNVGTLQIARFFRFGVRSGTVADAFYRPRAVVQKACSPQEMTVVLKMWEPFKSEFRQSKGERKVEGVCESFRFSAEALAEVCVHFPPERKERALGSLFLNKKTFGFSPFRGSTLEQHNHLA